MRPAVRWGASEQRLQPCSTVETTALTRGVDRNDPRHDLEKKIGVSPAVTGCVGALCAGRKRRTTEKQAYKAIDSQTIFIFGGTALAKALEMTGAGKLLRTM